MNMTNLIVNIIFHHVKNITQYIDLKKTPFIAYKTIPIVQLVTNNFIWAVVTNRSFL